MQAGSIPAAIRDNLLDCYKRFSIIFEKIRYWGLRKILYMEGHEDWPKSSVDIPPGSVASIFFQPDE